MDRLQILFKEYDTLRAEIIARQAGAYQATLIAGAVLAWFLAKTSGRARWLIVGGLVLLLLGVAYRVIKDECLVS